MLTYIWVLLLGVGVQGMTVTPEHKDPCARVECRAGRECVVLGEGAQCLCATKCPNHFTPVCGTDGVSYDNHCSLHQAACIQDHPISIQHKGFCKKSKSKKEKKISYSVMKKNKDKKPLSELDNEVIPSTKTTPSKRPAVCYASQRDTMRDLIIQRWEATLKAQPWHVEGMTYRESLWGRFFTCDGDKDNYMTPNELYSCVNDTYLIARPEQDESLTKALCIDALVDDGDNNQDWRLDFEEFTAIMNPLYHPKPKECSLEGKKYSDGKEVHVECNHCICAVGNWVCNSYDCDQPSKKGKLPTTLDDDDDIKLQNLLDEYDDLDDNYLDNDLDGDEDYDYGDDSDLYDYYEEDAKTKKVGKEKSKDDKEWEEFEALYERTLKKLKQLKKKKTGMEKKSYSNDKKKMLAKYGNKL